MDELMHLLATDGSASKISDSIKDILFQKSAENIEALRPHVAADMFKDPMDSDSEENDDYYYDEE